MLWQRILTAVPLAIGIIWIILYAPATVFFWMTMVIAALAAYEWAKLSGLGTAGRLLSTDVVSVRKNVSLAVVLRWLRRHQSLPPHTDALMVIDEKNRYLGKLDIGELLTGDPDVLVETIMQSDANTVKASDPELEVAKLFDRRDLISVAVLDDEGHLLGRITIDGIVDVIREESDRVLLNSAGLDVDEDMFAPVIHSTKRRGFWLGINLLTVFFAAWVIGLFEEALDKLVALAVLMPIVASMGGIAGSQSLTLTIRGMALDQIVRSNVRWLFFKELMVGVLNGLVWSLVVALVAFLWFKHAGIAVIIAWFPVFQFGQNILQGNDGPGLFQSGIT